MNRETVWTPVVLPGEPFETAIERLRYEDAVRRNPRQPGEWVDAWAERVRAAAHGVEQSRLPYRDPADEPDAEREG
jgi:hypothetical protein